MSTEVEVRGLEEAIQSLRKLDDVVANRILIDSLMVGARVLKSAVVSEAPSFSGLTKSKVTIKRSRREGIARAHVGFYEKDYTGDNFYAAFLIYGHKIGSRKLGDARKSVPANNFLRRAGDNTSDAVIEETTTAMLDFIEVETAGSPGKYPFFVWQGIRFYK